MKDKKYYENEASETEYLEWYKKQDMDKYEKPSVTVDGVIFKYDKVNDELSLLLIKRKNNPYKDYYALPGGFIEIDESSEDAIVREVMEETNLKILNNHVEQLYTFTGVKRDPRMRVISIVYLVFLSYDEIETIELRASDDAKEALFVDIRHLEELSLAFDHWDIVSLATKRIVNKMYYEPQKILQLLGEEFTIPQIRRLYARFLKIDAEVIDNSNLRKKMLPFLKETSNSVLEKGNKKPSKCYTLK